MFPRLTTVRMVVTSVSIRIFNNQYTRQALQCICLLYQEVAGEPPCCVVSGLYEVGANQSA